MSDPNDSGFFLTLSADDLSNRFFGDYHIIRRIGEGAMAEVYLAQQQSLSRWVALKILKRKYAEDENGVKRFVREAKAAASLVHPNIVHIYDVNCVDGHWFIAQEYVRGANLNDLLEKDGPLDPRQVTLVLWQVSSALQKAAQSGIVHRDIKPDNILIGEHGEMKVADFGLARVERFSREKSNLTQEGMTLGTPIYMSPEQAEGKAIDHRSDIYSLGITAYHLLSGSPPFKGDTALATALMHLNRPPAPLHLVCPATPAPLVQIIHKMIEKSPEKRYQQIGELQEDLRKLITECYIDSSDILFRGNWNEIRGEALPATDPHLLQARSRLEKTMEMEAAVRREKPKRRFSFVYFLGALILGMLLALGKIHARTPNFPPPENAVNQIPKLETIAEQWIFAAQLESEEGWISVMEYDPEDQATDLWAFRAKQQLAMLYMKNGDSERAFDVFEEFADVPEYEAHSRAFGFAGLYWYYASKGDVALTGDAMKDYFYSARFIREPDGPTIALIKAAELEKEKNKQTSP